MRRTITLSFVLGFGLLASAALADPRTPLRLTADDHRITRTAFHDLHARSNAANVRLTGMPDAAEQARTTLGAPLPVAMLHLDALRGYKPGTAIDGLVHHLDAVVCPVDVDRDVRTEVELVRDAAGAWQVVRVGAISHAREVARLGKVLGAPAYLLRVPALGVELLAYGAGDTLRLAAVQAVPGVDLKAGQLLPAADVMRVLAPLARAHKGTLPTPPR